MARKKVKVSGIMLITVFTRANIKMTCLMVRVSSNGMTLTEESISTKEDGSMVSSMALAGRTPSVAASTQVNGGTTCHMGKVKPSTKTVARIVVSGRMVSLMAEASKGLRSAPTKVIGLRAKQLGKDQRSSTKTRLTLKAPGTIANWLKAFVSFQMETYTKVTLKMESHTVNMEQKHGLILVTSILENSFMVGHVGREPRPEYCKMMRKTRKYLKSKASGSAACSSLVSHLKVFLRSRSMN
jgi:hypothetical protein